MKTQHFLLIIALSSAMFIQSGWAIEATHVEEKTFQLKTGSTVVLLADEGDIVINGWDKDEVYLKMTKKAWGRSKKEAESNLKLLEVHIQEGRNRLVIKQVENDYHRDFNVFDIFAGKYWREREWRDHAIDFELTVPKNIKLKLKADEGDIRIYGTSGELIIEVDEGDVEIKDAVSDQVDIQVDEGDVYCTDLRDLKDGVFQVDADEGSIHLQKVKIRELDLNTDEGDVTLQDVETLRFWISCDEGDIETDFFPADDGNYRLETEEGSIDVCFLRNPNLYIRLRTDEGTVDTDFDLDVRYNDDGEMAEGVIGKENGELKAFTEEGDIYLRKQ